MRVLLTTMSLGAFGARPVTRYSILVGVAGTLQTTAGQAFGRNDFEEVSLSLQRCFLLCTFMLCPIALMWLNARALLALIGQDPAVCALAARYLAFLLPGVFCYLVTQCLQNWLAAQRVTSPGGTGGLINATVYLPLCWCLMHPLGLGFQGAAIATSLSNVLLMLWMVFRTKHFLRTQLRTSWQGLSKQALRQWCPFLRLALPNFLMISEWWASEIAVLMAGTLPDADLSLAAMAMSANTNSICFMVPLSLGAAANTRVSNELGAGRPRAAEHAAKVSRILGLVVVAMLGILVFAFRQQWAHLFTTDARVLEHATPVLLVSAVYVLADGMATVTAGSLKGCARHAVLAPVVIASYYLVGLPCCWLLAFPLHLATLGLAWGSTIGTWVHVISFSALLATTDWPRMAQCARLQGVRATDAAEVVRPRKPVAMVLEGADAAAAGREAGLGD
mmetsp:Transcript_40672/g.130963  ORF Transcript_40672/g.130963 Transcript_40672/m.130963 type:complete len:448 (-) Transcript_40672:49-1392(-)